MEADLEKLRCWLRLSNGWTVSISNRYPNYGICEVAAWPTARDNDFAQDEDFFEFQPGVYNHCCWSVLDIQTALKQVQAAKPPKVRA